MPSKGNNFEARYRSEQKCSKATQKSLCKQQPGKREEPGVVTLRCLDLKYLEVKAGCEVLSVSEEGNL